MSNKTFRAKSLRAGVAMAALLLWSADSRGQSLELRIEDGRVFLDAQQVTVARILERWSALTGVVVTGADALADAPVSLVLTGMSERAALDVLLRESAGYVLTAAPGRGSAAIGRILIARGGAAPPTLQAPPPPPALNQLLPLLEVSADGLPQTGLDGPEQRLVDIAEGLLDPDEPLKAPAPPPPPAGNPFAPRPVPAPAPPASGAREGARTQEQLMRGAQDGPLERVTPR